MGSKARLALDHVDFGYDPDRLILERCIDQCEQR
jgi:hypothetical protein